MTVDALLATPQRRSELAQGLAETRRDIAEAAAAAGRNASELELIVVTKTYPASDVLALYDLGIRQVGENRVQEAVAKQEEVDGGVADAQDVVLMWHQIGQLQTNKAKQAVRYADWIHSVDRPELVLALSKACVQQDRVVNALIQVSLDEAEHRGGVGLNQFTALAEQIAAAPGLSLRGIMAVAPLGADPLRAFEPLRGLSEAAQQIDPSATVISAGMSSDLHAAVLQGATHLRVGSAILGSRAFKQ